MIARRKIEGTTEQALSRFAARARRASGLSGDVAVLLTDNREMRALNRQFRRKDKPTDVLSFPALNHNGNAGDIAISLDIAAENAERLGHPLATEIKVLIVHGMLHLAGYDHETDNGRMARRERELRTELKLPDNLIARNSPAARNRSDSPSQGSGAVRKTRRKR